MTRRLDMKHSRAALAEFDRTSEARAKRWDDCRTDDECVAAFRADQAAELAVREAFYLDTSDRNSHDNCMNVSLAFVRRLVDEFPEEP